MAYAHVNSGAYVRVCVVSVKYSMRILVTAPTDSHVIDSIMWYCWAHEKDGMFFASGSYIVHEGRYRLWRIYCEPNKYVDWLLLQYSDCLVVY